MKTKEKGYSLNVLVITIAVMIILISTAVVSMRDLTKDKNISEFMSDLKDVKEFALAYYSNKNVLPIAYENGNAVSVDVPTEMQLQLDESDSGKYYLIDLSKLDAIKLFDNDRGGYILNENTLNVYVMRPTEYEGVKYYAVTDELRGIVKVYGVAADFEVKIIGNPVVWTKDFKMLVSIPDEENVNSNWTFKYFKGKIDAKQFATQGTFFEYGSPIEIKENGVHSIYTENEEGYSKVTYVFVTRIDEVKPYVEVKDLTNEISVVDNETGIAKICYKIAAYNQIEEFPAIDGNLRALDVRTYMQGPAGALPSESGTELYTYEQLYTGESVNGVPEPHIGRSIYTYKADYQEYVERYAEIINASGDVRELDSEYPQFQYNGVPYNDDTRNIALYVEDFAGNNSVTNKNRDVLCLVSRKMLMDSHFIETVIKPISGLDLKINNGDEYTGSRSVDLKISAQGASNMSMFLTCDPSQTPTETDWIHLQREIYGYELEGEEGDIEVFAYITANQYEEGVLKYERISSSILLDMTPPTDTAPEIDEIGNDLKMRVRNKQKDTGSGIKKEEVAYKIKEDSEFTWLSTFNNINVEENKVYQIKTRTTDKVGNVSESQITEVKTPIIQARTLPNKPAMASGMKAIVWDGTLDIPKDEIEINPNTWKTADGDDVIWYNYEIGNGVTDTRANIWANAKTSDGSYWVWIPRYAYKITYYEDEAKTRVKGYYKKTNESGQQYYNADGTTVATSPDLVKTKNVQIDIVFLDGTSSDRYQKEKIDTGEITIETLPEDYIVHPAFTGISSSTISNPLGKWSTELTGIWVAKFEASRLDATFDSQGTNSRIASKPSVKSITNVKVGDAYRYSEEMFPGLLSHLMKSSEWGAVAYLAHSSYGRNGYEPSANRASMLVTGAGGSGTSTYIATESKFNSTFAYNIRASVLSTGMRASTTGNIYGVYDMVGGTAEFVATYLSNSNQNILENAGNMTQTASPALREIYTVGNTDAPINNYDINGKIEAVYGNSTYETSIGGTGYNGIAGDTTNFPSGNKPFLTRGGSAEDGSGAGLFNFNSSTGEGAENIGFRPVLAFR